jgi:large subunit ribosomal protein L21
MYAVIESGGKQYRVMEGQRLKIEKLPVDIGKEIIFEKVLMLSDENGLKIGAPYVSGAKVAAEVMEQGRKDKIRIIKHRRRKHYHREMGHRQYYTEIQIKGLEG